MSHTKLQYTAAALALAQAFSVHAQESDAVPSVVVTASRGAINSIGGFAQVPVLETPASLSTFSRSQLDELQVRTVTDVTRYDASVSDSYNAVGYAEQFSIRGFALDNTTSYRKDGFAIPGDTQIPLENKERVEILKGLSGLQAGVSAPGGLVNFVVKRPTNTPLRSATVGVSERGTLYAAGDLGGRFEDRRFGYRINAAAERLRSYVRGADGERAFVSGAFDWQIAPNALLQLDLDYQHKSQVTAPGYQLFDGLYLPTGVSNKMLLNDQPWVKPVDTKSTNLGLRFEYRFNDAWHATLAANKHWFKRDDYTAFPYGYTPPEGATNIPVACANGLYPGYCSNGDYDVYDYQSEGEKKTPLGVDALVQGRVDAAGVRHDLTFGASLFERHDFYGDYVYDYAGTSNVWHNVIVPPAPGNPKTGPVSERNTENERSLFAQDVMALANRVSVHAGLRYVHVRRNGGAEHFLLPNAALVLTPSRDWTVYGSIAHGMEHGGAAPIETENANEVLGPSRSKQVEIGTKTLLANGSTLSAALFDIRKGLEYTDVASNTYVRNGREIHRGIELQAEGRASTQLRYLVSLMALNTKQEGTGQQELEGKRVTDVPAFKSTAWLEYSVPQVPALKVSGSWQYTGKKAFDVANQVFVPGYHVFNLGASYGLNAGGTKVTLRGAVDNVFDKFYWRDVTPALGGYLLPGAPRVFRLSAQFEF
ncbi:TonB-dependent siderophore receptor [Massilia arenosa]|uniref:TonB-dependent siderophore receptor n=1 Tax=Zemynaea arenosa TaxID=2561931 RepID=A0A4Y9SJB0_9BURK|nr:TonB-dependent siderophore receptor [Massilia arenosa]TFW26230.1 TonB-dependent siderophore receptor [Massilia arenosa]